MRIADFIVAPMCIGIFASLRRDKEGGVLMEY